jgi:acyl carrier protein phosphodiesterase
MNYLAHLYLADGSPEAVLGSLMGDFVKGPLEGRFSEGIRRAILMHRRIDTYTDSHARVRVSRARISPARRRFAGIMVDVFYDHFLAMHWAAYSSISLPDFARGIYAVLRHSEAQMSPDMQRVARRMTEQDWLTRYRGLEIVGTALDRMSGRLRRENTLLGSAEELRWHYSELESDFRCFFPDLVTFVGRTARFAAVPRPANPDLAWSAC